MKKTAVKLQAAPEPEKLLKLDLGCGQNPREGFEGVDFVQAPGVTHVADLLKFPWPFKDASVEEVHCCPEDQPVYTPEGWRPIGGIKIGDRVLGSSGFVKVLRLFRRAYNGRVIRMETSHGKTVVTDEHPIALPDRWLKADEFGEAREVLGIPSEIQPADLVHRLDVEHAVTSHATSRSNRSMPMIAEIRSTAKGEDNGGLFSLPYEIWKKADQQIRHVLRTAIYGDAPSILSYAFADAPANGVLNASFGEQCRVVIDDRSVGIDDGDLGLKLMRTNVDPDEALAIDHPGKVGPLGRLHLRSEAYHFSGYVVNLETEDHTFFAGPVLTHNCSHFFEHVPHLLRGKFMDELYRVLVPEGKATIICPYYTSIRATQDFTHEWPPISPNSFLYFNKGWREQNKLTHGHYELKCDFDFVYGYAINSNWAARNDEARNFAVQNYINAIDDLHVTLTKRKQE